MTTFQDAVNAVCAHLPGVCALSGDYAFADVKLANGVTCLVEFFHAGDDVQILIHARNEANTTMDAGMIFAHPAKTADSILGQITCGGQPAGATTMEIRY